MIFTNFHHTEEESGEEDNLVQDRNQVLWQRQVGQELVIPE